MTTPAADDILTPLGPTALAPFAESPDEALETIFGFSSFRDGQRRAIDHLLDGRNALVVMPTGSGKSLCYQLVGAMTQGVTLVVSPLIALMKDQVDALDDTGLPATAINSSMTRAEQQRRIEGMYIGDYKIVYVAPERFNSPRFCRALEDVEIGLLAIDEAHCISQWGHDFRPAYRRLAEVRSRFGDPQTVALTATATEFVQGDIVDQLEIDADNVLVTGFERPNLYFEVYHASGKREKLRRMQALINHYDGASIIVYAATRKQVQSVADAFDKRDIDAATYHGGMSNSRRSTIQKEWMDDEVSVLVATNAFGMGVDKPDVRAVIHYNAPGSIEAYYQEAGRAGRDGEPAHCLLLFNRADTGIHEWFADNTHPLRMEVIRVWLYLQSLGDGEHEINAQKISSANFGPGDKIHPMAVETCLQLLSRAGHIRRSRGSLEVVDDLEPLELDIEFDRLSERRRIAKEQIAGITEYTSASDCFQNSLLSHFGTEPDFGRHCGFCANCDPPPAYVDSQHNLLARSISSSDEPIEVMRTVLSGVGRSDARRGVSTVAAMLVGSRSKAVKKAGFRRLDSYGSLDDLRKKDAVHLIELGARHGLIRRDDHGCVLLAERGVAVLNGEEPPKGLRDALRRDFC